MYRRNNRKRRWLFLDVVLLIALALLLKKAYDTKDWYLEFENRNPNVTAFAADNKLAVHQYPKELLELMENNPETEAFVLNYPLKKDKTVPYSLENLVDSTCIPLLMQWDERWGYTRYAGELMGVSGCGPVCLSMVCLYLLDDASLTPEKIAQFAMDNGFFEQGSGSTWTLISKGGPLLGLDVTEIPLDKDRIFRNLEVENPIICVMGPGDFTTTGHFIVLTGCENGLIRVNDPNSRVRSDKLWDYEEIADQIRNLWVCRA